MRKIICTLFCLLPLLSMEAQTLYKNQIRIDKESVARNEENNVLSIDMDIVIQESLALTSNHVVTLTPFLEANGRTKLLPPVVVYGRKREIVNQRNDMIPQDTYSIIRRKRHTDQTVNYRQQFPYEAWMRNAEMKLNVDVCGCCDLKEEAVGELITRLDIPPLQIRPAVSYMKPKAEIPKFRAIKGNAYLDFPVNKIIIYPEYRRNTVELAKIRASIDSVRNDNRTKLVGIDIHGYASPEGTYATNTRLAKGRTQALVDYATSYYEFDRSLITSDYTPEDWAGFRAFVVASSLNKKDELLKLIDDTSMDVDKKERQIAGLVGWQAYKYILTECYAALRHTDYTINYTVRTFTMEESRDIIKEQPKLLSLEEMYQVSENIQHGSDEFNRSFQTAIHMFPDDPVANLNAGAMEIEKGSNLALAKKYLAKADQQAAETINNLGVIALIEGNFDAAEEYFNAAKAKGLTTQAEANMKELKKKRAYPTN